MLIKHSFFQIHFLSNFKMSTNYIKLYLKREPNSLLIIQRATSFLKFLDNNLLLYSIFNFLILCQLFLNYNLLGRMEKKKRTSQLMKIIMPTSYSFPKGYLCDHLSRNLIKNLPNKFLLKILLNIYVYSGNRNCILYLNAY